MYRSPLKYSSNQSILNWLIEETIKNKGIEDWGRDKGMDRWSSDKYWNHLPKPRLPTAINTHSKSMWWNSVYLPCTVFPHDTRKCFAFHRCRDLLFHTPRRIFFKVNYEPASHYMFSMHLPNQEPNIFTPFNCFEAIKYKQLGLKQELQADTHTREIFSQNGILTVKVIKRGRKNYHLAPLHMSLLASYIQTGWKGLHNAKCNWKLHNWKSSWFGELMSGNKGKKCLLIDWLATFALI